MKNVKDILLRSLDDSTTELETFKETKKEIEEKLDAQQKTNDPLLDAPSHEQDKGDK